MTREQAKRISFSKLDETCPILHDILQEMRDAICLNCTIDEYEEFQLQDAINSAESKIRRLVSDPLRELSIVLLCECASG